MLIGVTGGIGCGKTMVARRLSEELRAAYCNSDEICRLLLSRGQAGYREFINQFGDRFLDRNGDIDRTGLRTHIFSDDGNRRQLESILHPLVRKRIQAAHNGMPAGEFVVAEVPLLFECGWERDFNRIICVVASQNSVLQRIVARDQVSRKDAQRIIDVQMDIEEKIRRSDWMVDNDGDLEQATHQVSEIAALIREIDWLLDEKEKMGQKT